ncbi:MAG: hypothetical protein GAK31_00847 [Stenotrophomonas maltophilia]|uniref:Uncharacterized protein n=1 Tax=Stenotrophomonas maltophilia TaxID=40324 RepID=A0A7V8JNK6_STEMA|nr:MAG: hypothetical protein GAK31_00847 [Stenotrophomonas maltophilia]
MAARTPLLLAAALAAALLAGCSRGTPAAAEADAAAATAPAGQGERSVAVVAEAFLTPMTPADNIDSPPPGRYPMAAPG